MNIKLNIDNFKKHELDFDKTLKYAKDHINGTDHILSQEVLKHVDFTKGKFFTILPEGADLDMIYDFYSGGILCYSKPCKVTNKTVFIIRELLIKNSNFSALFEDVISTPKSPHLEFFHKCGLLYEDTIYYLLDINNLSVKMILEAIGNAESLWHALFILTETNFRDLKDNNLTLDKVKEACDNIRMIIISAYDGESYIFWESSSLKLEFPLKLVNKEELNYINRL